MDRNDMKTLKRQTSWSMCQQLQACLVVEENWLDRGGICRFKGNLLVI
jgi:hypothetical protein